MDDDYKGNRTMDGRSARAEGMRARALRLLEIADSLENRPEEPANDGVAIVYFEKTFRGGRTYHYAALRAGGGWYITGVHPGGRQGVSWDGLLDFIEERETTRPAIYLATALEAL